MIVTVALLAAWIVAAAVVIAIQERGISGREPVGKRPDLNEGRHDPLGRAGLQSVEHVAAKVRVVRDGAG